MFFESLFEGLFRFADVTGFTVLARQLVYYVHRICPGGGPCHIAVYCYKTFKSAILDTYGRQEFSNNPV